MIKKVLFSILLIIPTVLHAETVVPTPDDNILTIEDVLTREPDDTKCATGEFVRGLAEHSSEISENASEEEMQTWITKTLTGADVLTRVLACPEIANAPDDMEMIQFIPIEYTFPGGRHITITYRNTPRMLQHRLNLALKKPLPTGGVSPAIGTREDDAIWTNTDPAWYGILVARHGALSEYIGPDKNNIVSLSYIKDNIDDLFPQKGQCTGQSAKTRDNLMLNRVMREKTVNIEDDSNDYYVAGDVNLRWLSYLEMAGDVILTVGTIGAGQAITGTAKAARASKTLRNLHTTMRSVSQMPKVKQYIRLTQKLDELTDTVKKLDKTADVAQRTKLQQEIETLNKQLRELERTDDNVRKFKRSADAAADINKYRHALRSVRVNAQTGNIIARTIKSIRAVNSGTKKLNKASRVARAGMRSGRTRDWLFHTTMQNIGSLGKVQTHTGILYGIVSFGLDMYDWTDPTTADYTNNIEFAPLLLLSADDLQGQENVVNHGMWLLWQGNSIDPADDDAAYLQAMDFASKFHEDLDNTQHDENDFPCDVDIYVVRPIIRNPGTPNAEIYYLFMNDTPWTTHPAE